MGRVLQAVRFMALHYPVDPDRVVLAGVSDGATGVYAVANAACAPFAGFIAVSGFGGMLPAFGMPLVAGNLMQRPIYNVNAGRDRLYPLDRVNEFLDRLRDQGVEVLRKEYPDEEHGFDYRDREWEAMAGLLRRWRRPRRTGLAWTFISGVPNCPPGLAAWSISRRPATIRGHRQNGLLHLDADGLARAAVVVPDAAKEPYRVVTLGTERRIRVETSAESYLSLMQRSCNPRVADRRVVIVEM
jgi:pimeloyl-ACP methyl ester carboxylesterase